MVTTRLATASRFARTGLLEGSKFYLGEPRVAETPTFTFNQAATVGTLPTTVGATLSNAGVTANTVNFKCLALGPIPRSSAPTFVEMRNAYTGLLTTGNRGLSRAVWEFQTDAPLFEIMQFGGVSNSSFTLVIDDAIVSRTAGVAGSSNTRYHRVDFSAATQPRRMRKVQIWGHSSFYFGGVLVTAADVVLPTPKRPKCIALTDSYGDGAGDGFLNFHQVLGRAMGWDVICAAAGSTGYLATNSGNSMKFRDRMVSDLLAFDFDVALVEGGINDIPGAPAGNTWNQAALEDEAALTWRGILDAKPNATLIVVGPMRGSSGNANAYPAVGMDTGFQAKAAAFAEYQSRMFYLPTISDAAGAWVFGTTTTGNFSSTPAVYGSSDGTHLLEPGQEYLGRRVTTAVVQQLAAAAYA